MKSSASLPLTWRLLIDPSGKLPRSCANRAATRVRFALCRRYGCGSKRQLRRKSLPLGPSLTRFEVRVNRKECTHVRPRGARNQSGAAPWPARCQRHDGIVAGAAIGAIESLDETVLIATKGGRFNQGLCRTFRQRFGRIRTRTCVQDVVDHQLLEGSMKQRRACKFHPTRRRKLNLAHKPCHLRWGRRLFSLACLEIFLVIALSVAEASEPESVLRTIMLVKADTDLAAMAEHMSYESDVIGIVTNWSAICATNWSPSLTWKRTSPFPAYGQRGTWPGSRWNVIPCAISPVDGVLSARDRVLEGLAGRWMVVSGHESLRGNGVVIAGTAGKYNDPIHQTSDAQPSSNSPQSYDLSGEWEILEIEDNRTYRATLDRQGNGPYTWQGGQFRTTRFNDRRWQGTWKQTGNDREGEFELVLSEDGTQAKGIWWYVRVGTRNNIPPRQHGGSYVWKRLNSSPPP